MANSYVLYSGTGAQLNWAVPFGYIDKAHVHFYVNNTEVTGITWPNSGLIQRTPAVAAGAIIKIARETPAAPLVNFQNRNNLTEANLRTATLQAMYLAAEAKDRSEATLSRDLVGNFDFENNRGINLADPVADQDAVTKSWAEAADAATVASVAVDKAIVAADKAIVAANTTTTVAAATNAATSASSAAASLDSFEDRYLGSKVGNPSIDNDGNALLSGALYWNTTVPEMRVWNGASWSVLTGGIPTGYLDADGLFAADSDVRIATQRAVNTRIKTLIATWPAFSAHKNGVNQTAVTAGVNTPVTFGTEKFDTGGFYDVATSRWTPPAGIASLSVQMTNQVTNMTAGDVMQLTITKNGAVVGFARVVISATVVTHNLAVSVLEPCNGTDFFAVLAIIGPVGGTDRIIAGGATVTWFNGRMISLA